VNKTLKIIGGIILGLIIIYLVWRFSNIVFYIIIAAVLSLIGRPLVKLFSSIKVGRFYIPNLLSTLLTMLIMVLVALSFVSLFVPLIARQASVISNIDFSTLNHSLQKPLMDFELFLIKYNFLGSDETLRQVMQTQLDSLVNFATFSDTLSSVVGVTGSIFIAVFSIGFLTFFFTKDAHLLYDVIDTLTPVKHQQEIQHILFQTKNLLSRYFIGLGIEVTTMITLLSIGLTIGGVHNALLIGFFGGLMNIIPYLGPIIGALVGVLLAVSSVLSTGMYNEILTIVFIVIGVFAGSNLIDNIVLQPLIYSNSVKAHPVEIYLVILIAGSMAGIVGMVLAIPTYTVIRVIAKEFFSQFRVVQRLTQNI
jgi:predicted PurR-regulated permease PerM